MRTFCSDTTNNLYQTLVRALLNNYDHKVGPRGKGTFEITDAVCSIGFPDDQPIVTKDPERNAKIARYTEAEFDLFNRGVNDTAEFANHAKFWEQIGNKDGTVNSAYGRIIWYDKTICECPNRCGANAKCDMCGGYVYARTPWQWCKSRLQDDRDTRQATLLFMQPHHLQPSKDLICTCHGQFLIRDGTLNLTVVMRSNDVVRGTVYDVPWFIHCLKRMSEEINVPVGEYVHIAHSLHLYESDLIVARSMIGEE